MRIYVKIKLYVIETILKFCRTCAGIAFPGVVFILQGAIEIKDGYTIYRVIIKLGLEVRKGFHCLHQPILPTSRINAARLILSMSG